MKEAMLRTIPIFQHSQYVKVTKVVLARDFQKNQLKKLLESLKKFKNRYFRCVKWD